MFRTVRLISVVQTLTHDNQVLKQGLIHLNNLLASVEPLTKFVEAPGGSVLLREYANVCHLPDPLQSAQATPLLHRLSAVHSFVNVFTYVCKVGQV